QTFLQTTSTLVPFGVDVRHRQEAQQRPPKEQRQIGVERLLRPEDARVLGELLAHHHAVDQVTVNGIDDPGNDGSHRKALVIHGAHLLHAERLRMSVRILRALVSEYEWKRTSQKRLRRPRSKVPAAPSAHTEETTVPSRSPPTSARRRGGRGAA